VYNVWSESSRYSQKIKTVESRKAHRQGRAHLERLFFMHVALFSGGDDKNLMPVSQVTRDVGRVRGHTAEEFRRKLVSQDKKSRIHEDLAAVDNSRER
jgi:hypothetical protein